ncbi:primosomal replication protein PriC [Pseudidiomarina aestuarii]
MTTTIAVELIQRLEQALGQFERQINALQIHRDNFTPWFDDDLFHGDAEHPLDYPREIRRHLQRLERTEDATQREWLATKVSDQLTALHQALSLKQKK